MSRHIEMRTTRLLLLTLLLSWSTPSLSGTSPYWVCVDDNGYRAASDRPCAPGMFTLKAPTEESVSVPDTRSSAMDPSAPSRLPTFLLDMPRQVYEKFPRPTLLLLVGMLGFVFLKNLIQASNRLNAGRRHQEDWARRPAEPVMQIFQGVASLPLPAESRVTVAHPQELHPQPTQWSLQLLRSLDWKRLELLIRDLWRARGYPTKLTNKGADGGIDAMIYEPQGAGLFGIAQCRSWANDPVGVATVREMFGLLHHVQAPHAFVYSVCGYTVDAKAFAQNKPLELVSGADLLRQIEELPPDKAAALLASVTAGDYTTPTCPSCDIRLVQRETQSGRTLWGCTNFPACRYVLHPRAETDHAES